MEKNTVKEIIKALKRLIYELKNGCCENLSDSQLKRLEDGFNNILSVEKEIKNDRSRLYADLYPNRVSSWHGVFHSIFSSKKEGE